MMKFIYGYFVLLWYLSLCSARLDVDDHFFNSCRIGDIATVTEYIVGGVDVSAKDTRGNTGLIIASGRGQLEVVKLLLQHGANVHEATSAGVFEGKTAISWACSQGRVDTAAYLIQAGADPQTPPEFGAFAGKNSLMWAASQGRTEVVQLLLSLGINYDYVSSTGSFKGKSALMWASSQGRVETVRLLLEAGADVNAVDGDGVSALMWAAGSEASGDDGHKKGLLEKAMKGHVKVVEFLLQYGAEPDKRDKDGITAIMFACFHGHSDAVRVLLNSGADADYVGRAGKTALQLAKSSGHHEAAQVVINGPTFMDPSNTLDDLKLMTACGWLIGVLRAPQGTGIMIRRDYLKPSTKHQSNTFSISKSCQSLHQLGLAHSLYDLLVILHGTGGDVEGLVEQLGFNTFASTIRAKMQLTVLHETHRQELTTILRYPISSSTSEDSFSTDTCAGK